MLEIIKKNKFFIWNENEMKNAFVGSLVSERKQKMNLWARKNVNRNSKIKNAKEKQMKKTE